MTKSAKPASSGDVAATPPPAVEPPPATEPAPPPAPAVAPIVDRLGPDDTQTGGSWIVQHDGSRVRAQED